MALLSTTGRQIDRSAGWPRWWLFCAAVCSIVVYLRLKPTYSTAVRSKPALETITEAGEAVSVSPDDPYAVKSSLQERATALDDGAVTVLQVDPVADTNSWDDVKANNLPPRPDEHCAGTVNPAESIAEQQQQLFRCRQDVAQQTARRACDLPGGPGGDQPFHRATLNIGHFAAIQGAPIPNAQSIPIAVEPHSDFVSNDIMSTGVWEAPEVAAILAALAAVRDAATAPATAGGPPDEAPPAARPPVLVDIGANLGAYTAVAAALGYPVIAFEALERNVAAIHQTLCWNPELLDRVTLFPYGLGDAERDCAVVSGAANVGDGHLVCSAEEWEPYRGEFDVRAAAHSVRLGDYLTGVHADVLKMDVEGYEFSVMRGAGEALDGISVALSEVSQDMAKKSGRAFEDVAGEYLRAWADRGFAIRFCDRVLCTTAGQAHNVTEALQIAARNGESNVLFSRQ